MTRVNQSSARAGVMTAILIAVLAPVFAGSAAAEDRGFTHSFDEMRSGLAAPGKRQPAEAPYVDPIPGVAIADGLHAVAEGVVATGYDSNIDHRVSNRDGGMFALTDVGLALIAGPESAQTTAVVRGGYGYYDIDYRPDRWDVGVLVDHYRIIAPDTSLNFGGFFLHDDIDSDANERAAGYYQFAYNSSVMEAFVRGRALDSHYLIAAGAPIDANRFFARDETFDHLRLEQSTGVLFLKDQRIAPFFEIGYANLDYNTEINPAVFSRDADEVWTIGGVRVTLAPRLHVDLGARYNQRWLDAPNIRSFDSVYFDGKLVWIPSDDLYVEFNIDRTFLEPIVDTALFTESTAISFLANARLDSRTMLKLEVGHITEDQVGAPDTFKHLYGEVRLTHEIADRTEIFASALGYHTTNTFTDLEADRVSAMVGVRVRN
ncbi:MAG: outer membrane beta-barrel protein [Hyphomicrobium sp.]